MNSFWSKRQKEMDIDAIYLARYRRKLVFRKRTIFFTKNSLFLSASGHYALLAARDPFKHVHQIGELISEPVDTSKGPKCAVFHFLMNGRTVRSLSVYLRLNNKYHKVWTRAGHQGNYWHRGAFTIPQVNVRGGLYVSLLCYSFSFIYLSLA